ncbi:response regulator, partial [bacterium]
MSKTLLAVDDSATMRKVFEITFGGDDFNVITAEGRSGALEKLTESPSVVLIDTSLEGDDPYALAKEIRQKDAAAVILLLSSKFSPYDAGRGKDAGADDNIDKPFDTQAALDKVRKALLAKDGGAPAAAPQERAAAPAPAPSPAAAPLAAAAAAPAPVVAVHHAAAVPTETTPSMTSPFSAPKSGDAAKTVSASANGANLGLGLGPKLAELGLTPQQTDAVLALSREVIERVVWEVVPQLAEVLIREEIAR